MGKALSSEEEKRLLEATTQKKRWEIAAVIIRMALLTAMRSGEITALTLGPSGFRAPRPHGRPGQDLLWDRTPDPH